MKLSIFAPLALTMLIAGSAQARITHSKVESHSAVKCTSTATATSSKSSRDAAVVAIVSAFDSACGQVGKDVGGHYVKKMERAYYGWAKVYASAVTRVNTKCTTSGTGYGCAAAQSSARAYSTASAVAFASASAGAMAKCGCVPHHKKGALTKAFGSASTFNKLIAQAFSSVSASVCAKHGQAASASVHQRCLASVLTKIFAKASAEALASNSCYSADAKVKIKAVTGAETYITEGCEKRASTKGSGKAVTGSKGFGSVEIRDLKAKIQKAMRG